MCTSKLLSDRVAWRGTPRALDGSVFRVYYMVVFCLNALFMTDLVVVRAGLSWVVIVWDYDALHFQIWSQAPCPSVFQMRINRESADPSSRSPTSLTTPSSHSTENSKITILIPANPSKIVSITSQAVRTPASQRIHKRHDVVLTDNTGFQTIDKYHSNHSCPSVLLPHRCSSSTIAMLVAVATDSSSNR